MKILSTLFMWIIYIIFLFSYNPIIIDDIHLRHSFRVILNQMRR